MKYLALRIAHNENHWEKPSKGRLVPLDGISAKERQELIKKLNLDYVKQNGFGHEDWNFNLDLSVDGFVYGYQRYVPKENLQNDLFNICFLDYDKRSKKWYIVGFYHNASYEIEGMPFEKRIVKQKCCDLRNLGNSLSIDYLKHLEKRMREDVQDYHWKVSKKNVVKLVERIPYPDDCVQPSCVRYSSPSVGINVFRKEDFDYLEKYAEEKSFAKEIVDYDKDEFPEGKESYVRHKKRERNRKIVERKKELFKAKHNGVLFCEACGMNFYDVYGEYGKDFIEVHHTIPVSELSENSTTQLSDLVLLCSNCHRMVHHRRPWLKKDELKKLLRKK